MKNIDDKMIEKALWNIRRTRKFKPLFAFCGIAQLVIVGMFVKIIWPIVLNTCIEGSSAKMTVFFTIATLLVFLHFTCGIYCLILGLSKNYKDAILERLAEQYLKEKQND